MSMDCAMFDVVRLIDTVDAAGRDRLVSLLSEKASASGAEHHLVAPTLPGSRNGGDVLLRLRFAHAGAWDDAEPAIAEALNDPAVRHINGATYTGSTVTSTERSCTVYRALLLRVQPGTRDHVVARFEDELRLLPRYVPSIVRWQLSRVGCAVGTPSWTHIFEQEFTTLSGLTGPYLMHPIHWAYVDRWFDPEGTDVIVRDRVCHSFCPSPTHILG